MPYPKPLKAEMGVAMICEDSLLHLAAKYPSYIGKSVNMSSRWVCYTKSILWPSKHWENSLDRVQRKQSWLLIRPIDWNLTKGSLDVAERCAIARLSPSINLIRYGDSTDWCRQAVTRSRNPNSGIYHLIVIPKKDVPELPIFRKEKAPDVEAFFRRELRSPSLEKVYVPLRRLSAGDFL